MINSPTCLLTQPNPGALHNINTPEDLAGTGEKHVGERKRFGIVHTGQLANWAASDPAPDDGTTR